MPCLHLSMLYALCCCLTVEMMLHNQGTNPDKLGESHQQHKYNGKSPSRPACNGASGLCSGSWWF